MDRDIYAQIIEKIKYIAEKINAMSGDVEEIEDIKTAIGTLANLTTTEKTNLVGAINEVDGNNDTNTTAIGTLASLDTTEKTNLVGAINEIFGKLLGLKYEEKEITTTANGDAILFNTERVIVFVAQKVKTDYVICLPYLYDTKTRVRCLDFTDGQYSPLAEQTFTVRVWYFNLSEATPVS